MLAAHFTAIRADADARPGVVRHAEWELARDGGL